MKKHTTNPFLNGFNSACISFLKAILLLCPSILIAQPAYDLEVAKPVAMAPYKIWQKDQVYGLRGMANVNNLGTQPFQNPKLKLDIFNSNYSLLWSDSMQYNSIDQPLPGDFTPGKWPVGYIGRYTVSQDVSDFNPADNQVEFSWTISDSIMSKEDIGSLGTGFTAVTDNNYSWGNIYHIVNNMSEDGSQLYCSTVQVGIANSTELAQEGASIFVFLYQWLNANNNNIAEADEKITVGFTQYDFQPGDSDNQIFTLPMYDFNTFNNGAPLESNSNYILAVQFSAPATAPDLKCYILADPNLNYSLSDLRDSLIQKDYGHHVLDESNTGDLILKTLGGNAVPVIRMSLSSASSVSGKVYLDVNCNQIFDNDDLPVPNKQIINLSNSWLEAVTDENGNYSIILNDQGTYSFSLKTSPGILVTPTVHNIDYNYNGQSFPGKDFSVCLTEYAHDLGVELTSFTPPRPGFEVYYEVCAKNLGTYPENAKLVFDFKGGIADSYTQILSADGGSINGHTITWDISDIEYFQDVCKTILVKVFVNTPLGTIFTPHAKVTADAGVVELTLLNNEIELQQEVVGSFDPNDKTVNKVSFSESDLKNGVDLEYIIRFQNTGNYPATFIEVLDTIQNTLDLEYFEMLSASHEFTFSILNDNILKWRFDNINLPDSTSNEPGSHGYIKFRIKTKENLTKQDVIANSAAIYFDFNLPVFTNTAKTEFVTPTFNILKDKLELNAYPNPVLNTVRLEYALSEKSDCTIEIIDPSGKVIENRKHHGMNSGGQSEKIDMSSFSSGVYLIRVITDKGQGESKVVKL